MNLQSFHLPQTPDEFFHSIRSTGTLHKRISTGQNTPSACGRRLRALISAAWKALGTPAIQPGSLCRAELLGCRSKWVRDPCILSNQKMYHLLRPLTHLMNREGLIVCMCLPSPAEGSKGGRWGGSGHGWGAPLGETRDRSPPS